MGEPEAAYSEGGGMLETKTSEVLGGAAFAGVRVTERVEE
jgi:hypothetical protein